MNKEIKLRNDIYSVGVIDNRPVPFHRLILEKGTTYTVSYTHLIYKNINDKK